MKKIFLSIIILFGLITSAQAEQWMYIKKSDMIDNISANMLDLDSLQYDKNTDSITFNVKKDDENNIYLHKMKYLYKNKQFAILETTKYRSWVAPENKEFAHTFDNPTYRSSKPDSFSELVELLISDKKNIDYLKKYSSNTIAELQQKLSNTLKDIDEANLLFWIDGKGNVFSYEYRLGNYNDSSTNKILPLGDELLKYSINIKCFPDTEKNKMSAIDISKKTLNTSTQQTSYSSYGSIISSYFIRQAMIPPNLHGFARVVYESQMPNYPDSDYGKVSNKDFYNKFISAITAKNLTETDKNMKIKLMAVQSLNYNEALNAQLKTIYKLEPFSQKYTKGIVGIVLKLK